MRVKLKLQLLKYEAIARKTRGYYNKFSTSGRGLFPPINIGGPIEATGPDHEVKCMGSFPPINIGGPIEAKSIKINSLA